MVRAGTGLLLSALVLAGCGGGGGGTDVAPPAPGDAVLGEVPVIPDTATASEAFGLYEGVHARVSADLDTDFANTAFFGPDVIEGIPASGAATYDGTIEIVLNTADDLTILYGAASVDANFTAGTLSGVATDFSGRDQNAEFDFYDGDLNLVDGIIGAIIPNDANLDYTGTLIGNGDTIVLGGSLSGKFKADPILGIIADDDGTAANVNGLDVTGRADLAVGATER